MPLRHKEGDEEHSTPSQPRQQMAASCQFYIYIFIPKESGSATLSGS